jgi:Rrf2 family transcriptional regulator, cysteine metabolism repressor
MQLSKRTQYGIRALVCFADAYERGHLQAKELSGREKLPPKFLEAILHTLTRAKFLVSKIGANGGYRLARAPKDISIGDIIMRLEGRHFEGQEPERPNERPGEFAVRLVQGRLEEAIHEVLSSTTLADLAEQVAQQAGSGQMYYI